MRGECCCWDVVEFFLTGNVPNSDDIGRGIVFYNLTKSNRLDHAMGLKEDVKRRLKDAEDRKKIS